MVIDSKKLSAAESLRSTRTYGQVRCHNPSCMDRLVPSPGAEQITCPSCGMAYRLFWVRADLPRIRGPVWDVNREIASETLSRKLGQTEDKAREKKEV
jgi:hypothetical protein